MNKPLLAHPIALAFPEIDAETFNGLVESLKTSGFDPNHPIVLFEGKILDGRNRYRACGVAKVQPVTREFVGTKEEAAMFSMRENMHRRHLTAAQKVLVAQAMLKYIPHEVGENKQTGEKIYIRKGSQTKELAAATHVSPRTVLKCQKLSEADPVAAEDVKQGRQSLDGALKKVLPKKPKVVASDATNAAAMRKRFSEIIHLIRTMKREIGECAKTEMGRLIVPNAIDTDFDNILRALRYAAPFATCPVDGACTDSCKLCRGTGWIGEGQYESLPKGLKPKAVQL